MQALVEQYRERIIDLCRLHHVQRLTLFGSALREDFDPERSDVDFIVEFSPLPLGEYATAYFDLSEALSRLFDRHVDLIEAGTIKNPYLQRAIEADNETLYAA
jgi:uncharacterized protein